MKSSQKDKKRSRRLLALLSFFFLAVFFSLQGLLTSIIAPVASPLVSLGTWVSDAVFWWREAGDISSEELMDLYAQRDDLMIEKAEFERLKEENAYLQEELKFIERTNFSYISARVLSKSISNSVSRLVIDVGS